MPEAGHDYKSHAVEMKSRGRADDTGSEVEAQRAVSRAWLKRECPTDEAAQPLKNPPKKRHHVASCEVLRDMVNIMRVAPRGLLSLEHPVVPEDREKRQSAFP